MPDADPRPLTPRPAGRIVLIDGRDRVLLLKTAELSDRSKHFWLTPGGGLEEGEDFLAAARRELWEEVGLEGVEFGPCVWDRRHVWPWGERMIASWERFFLVRVEGEVEFRPQALNDVEVDLARGHRWWRADDMAAAKAAGEVFVPRAFPTLLPPLLRGELPTEPIEIRPAPAAS